jgi:uncharacterized membrane protein
MNTTKLVMSAVAAAFALPMLANAQGPAPQPKWDAEHCYGVNAAGKNDCASTGNHSCAGMAKRANDPNSWIYVPKGVCEKIAGGSMTAK